MSESNKSYRIRTVVGQDTNLTVNLNQDYDVFEVLSIKLKQEDTYKLHSSNYGVIVGRVLANEGFGVPNAKISVFIKGEYDVDSNRDVATVYPYQTTASQGMDGVQYNLLPDNQVDDCHQVVGTFPNKTYMLDNDVLIEVFDEYYKYTTRTNNSGDYLICGVPTGQQTLHMDLDLSDCGILSQRPRDFVYKGYTIEQFENPNQFKTGSDLNSLSQIFRQDTVVNVIPFWGNEELGETIGITRADIKVNFKFEPTCVFMGSLVADNSSNGVSKKCVPTNQMGAMDELTTGEGTIEMIRKTPAGDVEEFQIKGTQLIDGNGVWCYQIPMNLDYMMTDEYGNMVPTDDPTKGIPTRARVRFRISMHDNETNTDNFFRAKVLVPHNPQSYFSGNTLMHENYDYEFGTYTKEESFRDLFWNNVYTVKSYIPRFQKSKKSNTDRFTGIKHCNIYGQNNPMPYNNIRIKMPFMFILLCAMIKTYVRIVYFVNGLTDFYADSLSLLSRLWVLFGCDARNLFTRSAKNAKFTLIADGICPDLDNWYFSPTSSQARHHSQDCNGDYYFTTLEQTFEYLVDNPDEESTTADNTSIDSSNKSDGEDSVCLTINTDYLMSCIEMNLAQEYKVINFDFYNDWVNGVIYMPRWMKFVRKKRTFLLGLIKIRPKVKACMDNSAIFGKTRYYTQQCALTYGKTKGKYTKVTTHNGCMDRKNSKKQKCHKLKGLQRYSIFGSGSRKNDKGNGGVVHEAQTLKNQNVYYFKPCEWRMSNGKKTLLFANDLVLLGSLNDCNLYGIPQSFKYLTSSSYVMPTNLALTNMDDDGYLYADDSGTICSGKKNLRDDGITQLGPTFENEQKYWSKSQEEDVAYGSKNTDDTETLNYDDVIPITEAAGIAWNYTGPGQGKKSTNVTKNLYYPGGHFLGISCTNSETNIKSCINLQRICEVGTTESQRREEVRSVSYNDRTNNETILYKYFVPTGLIAQDEISASDFRSMFATMNHKRLLCKDKYDEKTGYPIYDFMYLKPIGFDGALMDRVARASEYNADVEVTDESRFMGSQGVTSSEDYDNEEVRQTKTRTIEETSDDYYMFRLGLNTLNDNEQQSKFLFSKMSSVSLPQFENSYYFYFGLKDGATALDEFNKQFFSVCESKSLFMGTPKITTQQDFNPCTLELNLTVTVENMESPVTIRIKNSTTEETKITESIKDSPAVCVFENLPRGSYDVTATDGDGITISDTIQLGGNSIFIDGEVKDFEFKTKNITNPRTIVNSGKTLNCGYIAVGDTVYYPESDTEDAINDGCILVLVDDNNNYTTSTNVDFDISVRQIIREKIATALGITNLGDFRNYSSFDEGKFYVWKADADYDLLVVRKCEEDNTYYAAYYETYIVNGCDNYDIYLGSKFLPYSTELNNLHLNENWFNSISGDTKKDWAMRHALFRQTDDDNEQFHNNLIALNNNDREIDTVLFGSPEYKDSEENYRYSAVTFYEGDSDYYIGDVSDDSVIPTWPENYSANKYGIDGQGPKLHYGEMATYNGIMASDKLGDYSVTFVQDNDRIRVTGLGNISTIVVPIKYGCVVKLEDETFIYPVREDNSLFYYYGDLPENVEQTVSVYPVFYYPVMYRPFYAKQYTFDWITPRITIERQDNEEEAVPHIDCESWKTHLDIYNGITYEGKFATGSEINGEKYNLIFTGDGKNDLRTNTALDEGYSNLRTVDKEKITKPNDLKDSGYTLDEFGFSITEGSPSFTSDEEKLLNTPNALQLETIDGNAVNEFPTYIAYRYDDFGNIIFTSDNDNANVDFYICVNPTSDPCPLVYDDVVYKKGETWVGILNHWDYVLARYNGIAHNKSARNTVGEEVVLHIHPDTWFLTDEHRCHIPMYEYNSETFTDDLKDIYYDSFRWKSGGGIQPATISALHDIGVDVVNTYKPNGMADPKYFINRLNNTTNFKKIPHMGVAVEDFSVFENGYYIVALKKEKAGEKGEVNVVRVFPYDSVQKIQPYIPPSEPKIEVVPFGEEGVYSNIDVNSGSTFISDGGTLEIKVKSTDAWTFSFEAEEGVDKSWIKVNGGSTYSAGSTEVIRITANANPSDSEDRIVSGIAKTVTTHVDEEGHTVPYTSYVVFLQLRKQRVNYIEPQTTTVFSRGGGQLGVKVVSSINEGWVLNLINDSEDDWITFANTTETRIEGTGSTTVYLIADDNDGQTQRYATVTISDPLGGLGVLQFTQEGRQVELEVSPLSLNYPKTGNTQYVTVICNGAWNATKSTGSSWLEMEVGTDRIKLTAIPNTGGIRTANVTVSSNGVDKIVTVEQSDGTEKRVITTFNTTATTFYENNNIVISVESNTDWSLRKDNTADWFRFPNGQQSYNGTGNATLTCSVSKNTGPARNCAIETKAVLMDCIPNPETTVFFQDESDYSFYLRVTVPSFVVETLSLTLQGGGIVDLEEIYVPYGAGAMPVTIYDSEYNCNGFVIKPIPGMPTEVDRLTFMGITAYRNEYGNYVGSGNFTLQENNTYDISQ